MANKLDPLLTFRIVLDAPDEDAARALAKLIADLGLEAANVTARGLAVTGSKSAIEGALHARIDLKEDSARFMVEPELMELDRDIGFRAYFPTAPTYFGGN